ncbi:uncharacterized protein LTR77_011166 [Saxophila tyrrhenica]|uniref:Uncharacterized protein n=1 Tax=Saxophila tyrrhenica TaxID=1690608 RepID=A0AAV9NWX5_9PEZI|nr:hypothetical protein LTR77_011166 [Saxophila tyrrhenica]
MRLTTISCLLAALTSAYTVLAESLPQQTPSPSAELIEERIRHLEPRQGGVGVVPDATRAAGVQAPAITVYDSGDKALTYTQLFSAVPDQWPSAKRGRIGYGNLQKRDDVPEQAVETGIAGRIRMT